jgi:hypothetical protein
MKATNKPGMRSTIQVLNTDLNDFLFRIDTNDAYDRLIERLLACKASRSLLLPLFGWFFGCA